MGSRPWIVVVSPSQPLIILTPWNVYPRPEVNPLNFAWVLVRYSPVIRGDRHGLQRTLHPASPT
jgi:hypothetical protein